MKILVTHAYRKGNKGDAAILSVLLNQLQQAFPSSEVKISVFEETTGVNTFEGYKTVPSFMYLAVYTYKNIFQKLFYSVYIIMSTLLWAVFVRLLGIDNKFIFTNRIKELVIDFQHADVIIPTGGGYLGGKPTILESMNLTLLLHPMLLSIILRKPVVLYSQSIGPFFNWYQKVITRVILNRVNLILAREDYTIQTLKSIGVKQDHVIRSVDAGFLFHSKPEIKLSNIIPEEKLRNNILVGITVRKWLKKNQQTLYEQSIADFIDRSSKDRNILFIFIPQVASATYNDDDRIVATRILDYVKNKKHVVNLQQEFTHKEIKSLYSNLDYIIGTRFHSVIFSLTSYIPALAIEYEYKTSGIMKDLGLDDWVIPIEKVTSAILFDKFQALMQQKDMYLQKLHNTLPAYLKQAEENAAYIKKYSQTQ